MQPKRSARLLDVARMAGVGLATASRALFNPSSVREETRQRVVDAAALLDYVPHGAARALASRKSRTIATVIPTLNNPIFASSVQALQSSLAQNDYTLLVGSHEYDLDLEIIVVRAFIERGVDAVVLVGLDHRPDIFSLIARASIPLELTWCTDQSGSHYCVGFSNRVAATCVARHLLSEGHRRIAMITGHVSSNDRARERVAGLQEGLSAEGVSLSRDLIYEVPFSIPQARNAMRALLKNRCRPTAVACGNDILAIGALLEAQAHGITVPNEIAITGFDDIELAAEMDPGLTTVRLPVSEVGVLTATRLLARLSGSEVSRTVELPTRLIVRGSTACPVHRREDGVQGWPRK